MFQHLARPARLLLLGLLPVSLAACTALEEAQNPETTEFRGTPGRMEEVQPSDIAVAPIRNQTGRDDLPAGLFREAFAAELINRLYSPLALDYVDDNWVESSFAGTPAPDALLVVAITEYDPDHLYSPPVRFLAKDIG